MIHVLSQSCERTTYLYPGLRTLTTLELVCSCGETVVTPDNTSEVWDAFEIHRKSACDQFAKELLTDALDYSGT